MGRMTKSEKLAGIHATALNQFNRIQAAMRPERLQCLQDRRFYSIPGAQWEGELGEQFENKPKFEVNKVHLAVLRINNEYRNNRITVDFVSKDGSENDKLADICDGLYRADEQDSGGEEAFDNGFEEAVGGGMGAWRLRCVYEDEEDPEDERQRIRIEPIYDADTCVFFDLDSKRQDKADAKHCFVLSSMSPESYKEEWDDDPASWPKGISGSQFDWSTPDVVYVAEYYLVEEVSDEIITFKDALSNEEKHRQSEFDADEDLLDELTATGRREVKRRRIKTKKVHKYILSGGCVLDDCGRIPGKAIPIIPVYGKRWFVDNIERCMGHVRLAKDAQRLKNMQLSKLGEISALTSVEKPIFTPEQVQGLSTLWAEDNIKNYPYLLVNPITDANGQSLPAGPIAYTRSPQIPPAMAALLQITEQDMQEILGNPQQAEKMVSNISGKTVEMIQQRLDIQTFIYMSNMAKAMRRTGEVWIGMAREVYVEEGRRMKTLGTHGESGTVELQKPVLNKEDGSVEMENDLTQATFDVSVEVGPSSTSRRDSTVRSLTNQLAISTDPETQQVLQSMIMLNMEGEGIADVRDYFRKKLVKMGVLQPTEEEQKAMAAALEANPKDPNAVYLEAAADEATANATATRVKVLDTLAAADLKRAQAAKALSEAGANHAELVQETRTTQVPAPAGYQPRIPVDRFAALPDDQRAAEMQAHFNGMITGNHPPAQG